MADYEDKDKPPTYDVAAAPLAPRFRAEDFAKDGKKHVILACTGSYGMYEFENILRSCGQPNDITIRIVLNHAAVEWFKPSEIELQDLRCYRHVQGVYTDRDPWSMSYSGTVLEHELSRWADIMVIAPLNADTLAKITTGVADDLLTSLIRSWDVEGLMNPQGRLNRPKYLLLVPALNKPAWNNPITKTQLNLFESQWQIYRQPATTAGMSSWYAKTTSTPEPWAKIIRPRGNEGVVHPKANGLIMPTQAVISALATTVALYDST